MNSAEKLLPGQSLRGAAQRQAKSRRLNTVRHAPGPKPEDRHTEEAERYHASAEGTVQLELALQHLRDQRFGTDEARAFSSVMLEVLADGKPRTLGPVGRRRRLYHLNRRPGGLSIRAGEGRIEMPGPDARRVADLLQQEAA